MVSLIKQNKLVALSLFIVLVSIPLTVILVLKEVRLHSFAQSTGTQIYLTPTNSTSPPATNLTFRINPSGKAIAFVHTEIIFDKSKIKLTKSPNILQNNFRVVEMTPLTIANQNGRIVIALALSPNEPAPINDTPFATLTFDTITSQQNTNTAVNFDTSKTQIVDTTAKVIASTSSNAVITLNPSNPTNTPSVSPTTTPPSGNYFKTVAIADSFVRSSAPNSNFGTNWALNVKGTDNPPDGRKEKTYMKFDLSSLSGKSVKKAVLIFSINNGTDGSTNDPYKVKTVENNWSESTITWNNAPQSGALVAIVNGADSQSNGNINVTSAVKDRTGNLLSLLLEMDDPNTDNLAIRSKESSAEIKPQLSIEYSDQGSPTSTPVPVPLPTSIPGGTYEAEYAKLSGAVVDDSHGGYTGSGFADYKNSNNDYVEWTVNVPSEGNYVLNFRYALSWGNRPLQIKVNGGTVESSLDFPKTGSWTKWETTSTTALLKSGFNKIRATAIGNSGANIDHLEIQPSRVFER